MRCTVIFLLTLFVVTKSVQSQQLYNNCSNAFELCPAVTNTVDNLSSTVTFCPGCEDDFNFCFSPDNTIWFTFTTNATGGDVQIDFSNIVFQNNAGQDNELQATIIESLVPCNAAGYTQIGNCISATSSNFSLIGLGLLPSTVYYVVLDGDNNGVGITSAAEFTLDLLASGPGIDRPVPAITLDPVVTSICINDVVTFNAHLLDCPSNSNFSWYINDTLIAVTTDSLFSSSILTSGDVLKVETTCYTSCIDVVSVNTGPFSAYSFLIDAGPDIVTAPNVSTTISGFTSAPDYSWSPGFLFSDPNNLNSIVSTNESVTLTLTATENGCTQSDDMTLTVHSALDLPNTFSPNGDGINEVWIIEGIELFPENTISIYTRWGQEIFRTSSYSLKKAWDGTFKSRKAAEGVYFYILDLKDEVTPIIKGTITLIR